MTPRLPSNVIEEIKQRADIVDVVSEYVLLQKRGKDFVGLCPFHDEKTPSFTVSQSKQMYYCFGCQSGGTAIKFLMDLGKHSFAEVVLDLARRYQVSTQTLEPEQHQELQRQISLREQLYEVLASAEHFYQHALRQSHGKKAYEHLQRDRQLKEETIQQFHLGYAPPGWETLHRYLVEDKRYPAQLVEKAGLIKPRKEKKGYYDVFRDRLMIPIRDTQGRVIAFGGRTLSQEQPKYLNSPETELFTKGKTLFALDQAKGAIAQLDQVIVVEGYFDAICLHGAGITNVVASLGTALSIEQVKLALRYTESKELVLNFDADKAGYMAIHKALKEISPLTYKGQLKAKILTLPANDPGEYLQNHQATDYCLLLKQAVPWIHWQIQEIINNRDLKQATDFQVVCEEFVKILKQTEESIQSYYVSYCAEILSLGDGRLVPFHLERLLSQITAQSFNPKVVPIVRSRDKSSDKSRDKSSDRSLLELAEALLLKIYIHCPDHRQNILTNLEQRNLEFSFSHHRLLWQDMMTTQPEDIEVSELSYLFQRKKEDILSPNESIQAATACMEIVLREKRYRYFLELWEKTDESDPKSQIYYESFYKEKMLIKQLNRQRVFVPFQE